MSELGDRIRALYEDLPDYGEYDDLADRIEEIQANQYRLAKDGKTSIVSEDRSVHIEADEYHTMDELYEYRMVFNAYTALYFADYGKAVKSWKHHDGEECFGGGWFIVCLETGGGWATSHYKAEHWRLFDIPEVELAPEWDGHTPAEALARLMTPLRNPLGL